MGYIFRFHRAGLIESLQTQIDVRDIRDLAQKCEHVGEIKCKYYMYDDRIHWDTWIVTDSRGVLGFANGNLTSCVSC